MATGFDAATMYAGNPVFNQVDVGSAYFPVATENPANVGRAGQDVMVGVALPGDYSGGVAPMVVDSQPMEKRGVMGKPANWWLMLVLVLAVFIFVSRRYGGEEKFGNIRLTLWNGIFAVLFYVIILNFLKVFFAYFKVKGLSELVAAA
jgi:hypothetical protein